MRLSSPSNLTMGWPPDSFSTRFWGRNRATTLMLFALEAMVMALAVSCGCQEEGGGYGDDQRAATRAG